MDDLTPERVQRFLAACRATGSSGTVEEDIARALLQAWEERDKAQAAERARIVAWLRTRPAIARVGWGTAPVTLLDMTAAEIADAIARGEHSPDRGEESEHE